MNQSEMSEFYKLANEEECPINLPPKIVEGFINSEQDQTIVMLKPDALGIKIGKFSLQELFEALVFAIGLEIKYVSKRILTPDQVFQLYREVLSPNLVDDAQYGTKWKSDVINHLSSSHVFSYLIDGKESERKMRIVKNNLRSSLCTQDEQSKIVRNIAHVPDADEFNNSFNILFL